MENAEEYWSSPEKLDQKFYVAFCMFSSLLENYLSSVKLRNIGLGTWSNVCAYYTAVVTGRLMSFIACGDFPKFHAPLATFLKTGKNRTKTWLTGFIEQKFNEKINRNQIVKWLNEFLPDQEDWDSHTKRWGEILENFSNCRNGVNYEGLITAHRMWHVFMTSSFKELEEAAELVSIDAVNIASKILNGFIVNSPRYEYWISYLNWDIERHGKLRYRKQSIEGIPYLRKSLKRLMSSDGQFEVVDTVLIELEELGVDDPTKSEEFYEHISFSKFGKKSILMFKFSENITKLHKSIIV